MKITIIGIGALGSQAAMELNNKAELFLIDRDFVEEKNLRNQPFYDINDLGKTKIEAAISKLNAKGTMIDLDSDNIEKIGKPDLIICCTDTMQNKFLINEYCKKENIPAIYVSAAEKRAMILPVKDRPCFSCLFKKSDEDCELNGISIAVAKAVGKAVAIEAMNIFSERHVKKLIYINDENKEEIKIKQNIKCRTCNGEYKYINSKPNRNYRLCGGTYILKKEFDFSKLNFIGMKKFTNVIHHNGITFFSDGRVFVKARNEREAEKKFSSLTANQ